MAIEQQCPIPCGKNLRLVCPGVVVTSENYEVWLRNLLAGRRNRARVPKVVQFAAARRKQRHRKAVADVREIRKRRRVVGAKQQWRCAGRLTAFGGGPLDLDDAVLDGEVNQLGIALQLQRIHQLIFVILDGSR